MIAFLFVGIKITSNAFWWESEWGKGALYLSHANLAMCRNDYPLMVIKIYLKLNTSISFELKSLLHSRGIIMCLQLLLLFPVKSNFKKEVQNSEHKSDSTSLWISINDG